MILNGWKEIANHLGRGVRTVQRLEAHGLPIRRPKGTDRSAVIALNDELDAWVKRYAQRGKGKTDAWDAAALDLRNTLLQRHAELWARGQQTVERSRTLLQKSITLRHHMEELRKRHGSPEGRRAA